MCHRDTRWRERREGNDEEIEEGERGREKKREEEGERKRERETLGSDGVLRQSLNNNATTGLRAAVHQKKVLTPD